MGAGVLPTTVYKNKLYFLFGKERDIDDTPGWSDFGGGQDNSESQMDTAVREAVEEMTGFLGSEKDLEGLLKKHGTKNYDIERYRTHIFPLKYDETLPFYYNNNQRFLQKRLSKSVIKNTKIFEKAEIKWVCEDDLIKMMPQFRSFYKTIVEQIYGDRTAIKTFVKKGIFNKTYKRTLKKNKTRKIT
jgi:8-oxo-dGTP pyrophosphatase MutT (NUDIX family)